MYVTELLQGEIATSDVVRRVEGELDEACVLSKENTCFVGLWCLSFLVTYMFIISNKHLM